jgi:hypothetical protein
MFPISTTVNIPLPENVRSLTLRAKVKRIDFFGSLTLVLTVGCLLFGLSLKSTEELPWSHPLIWSLISVSCVWGVIFVIVETKVAAYPVMPIRLVKQRTPLTISFTYFFASVGLYSMLYNVPLVHNLDQSKLQHLTLLRFPQYFSAVRLNSSTDAGLHLLPHSVRGFNLPRKRLTFNQR